MTLSDAVFTANLAGPHPTTGTRAGGGVLYADRSAISISRATLNDNGASGGTDVTGANYADALHVLLPTSVEVLDSTFSPMRYEKTVAISPGSVAGLTQGGCEQRPCALGSSCKYSNFSTTCTPCTGMSYSSNGIACQACARGFGPKADKTGCDQCAGNNHSSFGVCLPCPAAQVVVTDQTRCEVCPVRQTTVAGADETDRRGCGCADGFYNDSSRLRVCFDRGYDDAKHERALRARDSTVATGQVCSTCTTDWLGEACMDCPKGEEPLVLAGYTIPQLPAESSRRSFLYGREESQMVFRCDDDMEIGAIRCPENTKPGECRVGYSGHLCASCAKDYGMMASRMCEACEDQGYTMKSLLLFIAMVVGLVVIVCLGIKYWSYFPAKYAVRCAFQPMRIVITCE